MGPLHDKVFSSDCEVEFEIVDDNSTVDVRLLQSLVCSLCSRDKVSRSLMSNDAL